LIWKVILTRPSDSVTHLKSFFSRNIVEGFLTLNFVMLRDAHIPETK